MAARVQGEVLGDPGTLLTGIAAAENAGPGDLTFADNAAHFSAVEGSGAAAILVPGAFTSTTQVRIPRRQCPRGAGAVAPGVLSAGAVRPGR